MGREHLVRRELGTNSEPPGGRRQSFGRLPLRVPGADPAQERNAGADYDDSGLELGERPHEQSRNSRSEREDGEDGAGGGIP
jgi:hypothetical protein